MKKWLTEFIAALFIFLFIYAASSKLLDVEKFRVEIGQSPLLTSMADIVAWLIPLIEIAAAIFLAIPAFRAIGFLASFALMILFTSYIIMILQFSEQTPCSCGGVLQVLGWREHLIFNIVFVLLSATGVYLCSASVRAQDVEFYGK